MFPVPRLLDPGQPADWNYQHNKDEGEIIVCLPNKGQGADIEFLGPPTPDMVPLDDEAKAASRAESKNWSHPIESLSGTYADEMMKELDQQVAEARANATSNMKVEGLPELLAAMATMMKQNQDILAALAKPPVDAPIADPVVNRPARRA